MVGKDKLRMLFQAVSIFGTPFFYIPMTAYFLKTNPNLAIKLVLAIASTEIICGAVKYIYPKARPIPMPSKTLIQKYFAGSFPSVHTARITAFSVTVILSSRDKLLILIGLLAIACVGYSRIYLKKHYFIDVAAGFGIGAVLSLAAVMVS